MSKARIGLMVLWVYLSFIGGGSYQDLNLIIQIGQHLLLTILLLWWLVELIRKNEAWPVTVLDGPALALVIWWLVTSVTSLDWRVSLEQTWLLLIHVGLVYWLVAKFRSPQQRWVMEATFLVAALVVMVSAAEWLSWYFDLGFGGVAQGWWPIGGMDDLIPPHWHRLSLAMNVATWLGNYIVVVLPLTLAWASTSARRDDRQALYLLSVGLLGVLFFTQSRGGFIGLAVGGAAAFGLWQFTQWRGIFAHRYIRWATWGLAIALFIGFVGMAYSLSRGRATSDQGRLSLWRGAADIIETNPIAGVGVYQYGSAWRNEHNLDSSTDHLKTAHNLYLNTTAEIGLVGLAIIAWGAVLFLWHWWRQWQHASATQRIRLLGILTALIGFAAQSMVDTFTYTSTLLPVLVALAYGLANQTNLQLVSYTRWHLAIRWVVIVGIILFGGWLALVDYGKVEGLRAIAAIGAEDYAQALASLDQAQAVDPQLRLYDLQRAYVLGLLADEQPDSYLDEAIQEYEAVIQTDSTFYVGYVNLAALYAQAGQYKAAQQTLTNALDIRTDLAIIPLQLGRYYEADGQTDEAIQWYLASLQPKNPWVASAFWQSSPTRQAAFQQAYQALNDPTIQLFWAVDQQLIEEASTLAQAIDVSWYMPHNALGYYAAWQGNFEQAIDHYQASLALYAYQPWAEAQLAASYLAQGDLAQAEHTATLALFLNQYTDPFQRVNQVNYLEGTSAYFVLAQVAIQEESATDAQINDWLLRSVVTTPFLQSYEDVIFSQVAYLPYLPQVELIGLSEALYAPWFLLAERYAADDDPDTDPIAVYEAILNQDAYVERARILCGAECRPRAQ